MNRTDIIREHERLLANDPEYQALYEQVKSKLRTVRESPTFPNVESFLEEFKYNESEDQQSM